MNKGRSIRINKDQQEDYKNNLWIEFYIIKPSFSPISTFISQTEKRNQYSLISQCKTFSYNQSIQVLIEDNKKLFACDDIRQKGATGGISSKELGTARPPGTTVDIRFSSA